MNGCNVIKDKKVGNLEIKVVPNAPHGFDKEAYAGKNSRVGLTKGRARYQITYDGKAEKIASAQLKQFLTDLN